jgi:hypothetical protein
VPGPMSSVKCPDCGHTPCEANPTGQSNEECAAEAIANLRKDAQAREESRDAAGGEGTVEEYIADKIVGHESGPPCYYS